LKVAAVSGARALAAGFAAAWPLAPPGAGARTISVLGGGSTATGAALRHPAKHQGKAEITIAGHETAKMSITEWFFIIDLVLNPKSHLFRHCRDFG
jgi:hypothetical protein